MGKSTKGKKRLLESPPKKSTQREERIELSRSNGKDITIPLAQARGRDGEGAAKLRRQHNAIVTVGAASESNMTRSNTGGTPGKKVRSGKSAIPPRSRNKERVDKENGGEEEDGSLDSYSPKKRVRREKEVHHNDKKDEDEETETDCGDIDKARESKTGKTKNRRITEEIDEDDDEDQGTNGNTSDEGSEESPYVQRKRRKKGRTEKGVGNGEELVRLDEDSGEGNDNKAKKYKEREKKLRYTIQKLNQEREEKERDDQAEESLNPQTMLSIGLAVKYTVFKSQKFIFGTGSFDTACKAICNVMKRRESSSKRFGRIYRKHIQKVFNQQRSICSQAGKETFWSKDFVGPRVLLCDYEKLITNDFRH